MRRSGCLTRNSLIAHGLVTPLGAHLLVEGVVIGTFQDSLEPGDVVLPEDDFAPSAPHRLIEFLVVHPLLLARILDASLDQFVELLMELVPLVAVLDGEPLALR